MDPHNLAVCFGPTLVTVPAGQDAVSVQPHVNEVVKCLIMHYEVVFPGISQLAGPQYEKVMALAEEEYWYEEWWARAGKWKQDTSGGCLLALKTGPFHSHLNDHCR